jgi:hypothetical protein
MTEMVPPVTPVPSKGLLARAVGIIFSPRATYAAVAAQPRVFGALVLVVAFGAAGTFTLLRTEVGQKAALDQQVRQREAFGRPMSDAEYAQVERVLPYFSYIGAATQIFFFLVIPLVVAGLMFAIFTALMGGNGTFKQVWAIVVHSGFIVTVQQVFVLPLDYFRESVSSPTTLAAFVPFLEDTSFGARFLGAIDLFLVWWILNLSIGLGVLYKKRTFPIATSLLVLYVLLGLVIAAVRSALSGA